MVGWGCYDNEDEREGSNLIGQSLTSVSQFQNPDLQGVLRYRCSRRTVSAGSGWLDLLLPLVGHLCVVLWLGLERRGIRMDYLLRFSGAPSLWHWL
jgi:hypothetical protein